MAIGYRPCWRGCGEGLIRMSLRVKQVRQRKKNIVPYHLYVEDKKNDTNKLIYKTETDLQT